MKEIRICIAGNSVALRTRPPQISPGNKNYTVLLREKLNEEFRNFHFSIENKAVGACTVKNIYQNIELLTQCFPDIYILNIGVVDSCNREVPLWFYRLATRKSEDLFSFLIRAFYRSVVAKARPFLVYLRLKRPWIPIRRFRKYYTLVLETLQKETNGRVIIVPINPANARVEKLLPGTRKNHLKYNKCLLELSLKYNASCLNLEGLDSSSHYPDGIHYSIEGHQEVAGKIQNEIIKILKLS